MGWGEGDPYESSQKRLIYNNFKSIAFGVATLNDNPEGIQSKLS